MQPGYHTVVSIGIVELVSWITDNRPQGAETLLPLVWGVLVDLDHVIDKFVGKESAAFNPEAEGLTVEEAAEKCKWHFPHYIIVGVPLILLASLIINRLGARWGLDWLELSGFWIFWGGVVPFLAHTLSDVTFITHGGDWNVFPLNYLLRWLGIRLPLGIVPNGTQMELWIEYFVNTAIIIAFSVVIIDSNPLFPLKLIVEVGLMQILGLGLIIYGVSKILGKEKLSPKVPFVTGVIAMLCMAFFRWPLF